MAAASALLAVSLAGPPLYVSSATTEALQVSLAAACPSDAGIVLNVTDDAAAQLDVRAQEIGHVERPDPLGDRGRAGRGRWSDSATLLWRDGYTTAEAGDAPPPAAGQILVPASFADTAASARATSSGSPRPARRPP